MRNMLILGSVVAALLISPGARAHELWFHSGAGGPSAPVRLSFGDSPEFGEAERVAEIADTKVWADGKPLEVKRLPDGLEATLPQGQPALLSAFADRGVVNYKGESFIIFLAAYAQTRAVALDQLGSLGLSDDQARLLLISKPDGPPVVTALWKGRPAVSALVKVFHESADFTEFHTDANGQIPCPDLREGPWSLLLALVDKSPGKRDGRDYSEIRYKATLAIGSEAAFGPAVAVCLARVKETHGAAGPWAVAGYRIGERALKELHLPRHSFALDVVHYCPQEVQYSCIADGLQAATGVSPGKLNLHIKEVSVDGLKTTICDRKTNRCLTFTLKPDFARSILNLPHERMDGQGQRVAALPDDEIFSFSSDK
jgi:formylmethanofuran dehydrogenase subunit E